MTTTDQPALFDAPRRPRPPKPPSATDATLSAWRNIYKARFERDFSLPSSAAWAEIKKHCKRLAELIPDVAVREAFLDAYARTADRYERDRGCPLRLALRDERFQRLAVLAEREVAEKRRIVAEEPRAAVARAAAPRPTSMPRWRAFVTKGEVVLGDREFPAPTRAAAQARADEWFAREYSGRRDVFELCVVGVARG